MEKAAKRNYEIVRAKIEDLDEILALSSKVVSRLNSKGIYDMGPHYPLKGIWEADILRNELFLLRENNSIIGTVCLSETLAEPQHEEAEWFENHRENWVFLKRLLVDPDKKGQNLGDLLLNFAEVYCVSRKKTAIRLQVSFHTLTIRLQDFYLQHGYLLRKILLFPKQKRTWPTIQHEYFALFEKPIASAKL